MKQPTTFLYEQDEHGIATITPAVMDRARSDLGLEGM